MKPVRVKPPSKKKPLSRSWQYFIYGLAGLAILIVISVMLPQVDTSLDAAGSTYTPPPPSPRKENAEAASEDVIDENNPLEVLTRRLKQSLVQYRAGVEGSAEALVEAANELSTVYIHAKYYNEAITICTQTVTVIEEHFGASSLRLLPTLKLLTEATQLLDKWADSVSFLTYIESVMRAHYGLTHPDSISITSSILRMYSQLGDFQTANDVYRMNEALYHEELKAIASRKDALLAMQAAGSTGSDDLSRDSSRDSSSHLEMEMGDVALQIAHADREAIDLRTALADMSLIQGSIYRRLYATFMEGERAEGTASLAQESSDENDENNEQDEEGEDNEDLRSFFEKKENMPLMQEKAHHFFAQAVENFEQVLGAIDQLYEGRPGATQDGKDGDMALDHVRHVSDATFKLAQALQSFAHMRYQLEREHDDETLALFQAVVQQSRRLDALEGVLEQAAALDLQHATGVLTASRQGEGGVDSEEAEREEAVETAEQNLQRAQKQHLAILTDLAVALNNLGSLYTTREQLPEAEEAIRESIHLREHVHEAADVAVNPVTASVTGEIAVAKSSLAKVLYLRGEVDEAQREFREALAMAEQSHGKTHDLYHRVNAIVKHTIPALSDESDLLEEPEELYDYTA
mmetsp:Transcript_29646/g.54866  ORF Transcript_29646/g.54866 Transcript_29646/m.54866 type:complete len:635 (+) Transcript_29646:66-1970(+)